MKLDGMRAFRDKFSVVPFASWMGFKVYIRFKDCNSLFYYLKIIDFCKVIL